MLRSTGGEIFIELLSVAMRRQSREAVEGGGELALVREAAGERDLRDRHLRGAQERLRAGDTNATDVFADGAAEAAMKLAADLDGMATGRASQVSECEPSIAFFMQHLVNAPEPRRNGSRKRQRLLCFGQQELECQFFHGERREVVVLAQFGTKKRAQSGGTGRGELPWHRRDCAVFARAPHNVVVESDEQAAGAARKIVFMAFAGGKKADGSGDASVTAVTVGGPVETGQSASEEGQRVGVAGDAETGGV